MKLLFSFIFTILCLSASAQEISIGVEGGIFRSSLKKGVPFEYHYKYEPVIGIFCNTPITNKLKLNTMLSLSRKGSNFSHILPADETSSNTIITTGYDRLSYISLHPRVDYYLHKSVFLYVSPYISMLSKIQKYRKYDVYVNKEFSHSITDKSPNRYEDFNHVDFGIGAGLGFNYPKNAFLRIGVERGFINVIQDMPYNYHMTYMATLGYSLFNPEPKELSKED